MPWVRRNARVQVPTQRPPWPPLLLDRPLQAPVAKQQRPCARAYAYAHCIRIQPSRVCGAHSRCLAPRAVQVVIIQQQVTVVDKQLRRSAAAALQHRQQPAPARQQQLRWQRHQVRARAQQLLQQQVLLLLLLS